MITGRLKCSSTRKPKTLDVHVKRVRSKIEEDPAHPKYLTTVRGLGYKIDTPAE